MSGNIDYLYTLIKAQKSRIRSLRHDFTALSSPPFDPDMVCFQTQFKAAPPVYSLDVSSLSKGKDAAQRLYATVENYIEQSQVARTLIEAQTALIRKIPDQREEIMACRKRDSRYTEKILAQAQKISDRLSRSGQAGTLDMPAQRERLAAAKVELYEASAGLVYRTFFAMPADDLASKIDDMRTDFADVVISLSHLSLRGQEADLEDTAHLQMALHREVLSPAQERRAVCIFNANLGLSDGRLQNAEATLSNIAGFLFALDEAEKTAEAVMKPAMGGGAGSMSRLYRPISLSNLPQFAP